MAVRVSFSAEPPALDRELPIPEDWSTLVDKVAEQAPLSAAEHMHQQQQQQQ